MILKMADRARAGAAADSSLRDWPALGDRVNKHEVHIGPGGGQRFPCFRRAGLHQQWMALRRARDVEGAHAKKVLALILEMMHLVGIGK